MRKDEVEDYDDDSLIGFIIQAIVDCDRATIVEVAKLLAKPPPPDTA